MTTTTTTINDQQLELGLPRAPRNPHAVRREQRLTRAAWWFNKMRAAVNGAMDWPPTAAPRPEQTFLPGSYRQIRI